MLLHKLLLSAIAFGSAIAAPVEKRAAFNYGSTPVRGVNIGGWLVLEPWITPSMFDPYNGAVLDEHSFCQNAPDAASKLQAHWASWATLADFQKIAANGFNLVRIPIGYWAFEKYGNDMYIQGAAEYMEKALGWARQTGLKVWIDLHGAPESQNGFDNSGERIPPAWSSNAQSVTTTQSVIQMIAQRWGTGQYADVLAGIELLNEPLMSSLAGGKGATQSYYQNGYNMIKEAGNSYVIMHDGFANPSSWNGFLAGQGASGAVIDHHEYQVFSPGDLAMSHQQHVDQAWARVGSWGTGQDKFLVCGEWTAAMTDCAKWLNGYGRGARYDGSYGGAPYVGSCATISNLASWTPEMRQATTNYISAQIQAFESHIQGWIFWNFKTESAAEWDLFQLLDNGVWPKM